MRYLRICCRRVRAQALSACGTGSCPQDEKLYPAVCGPRSASRFIRLRMEFSFFSSRLMQVEVKEDFFDEKLFKTEDYMLFGNAYCY